MKTNVEVLESGATKLTVTIEAADIDARIKKAYKDFGKKYKFPGFRPGHVPRQIIDANLGKEAVLSTVTDEMLNESFPVAIDEADLILISEPKFSEVDGLVEEGKDFTFSIECEVKPALELSDYSPVHIEVPFKTASEAEIDREIDNLGNAYHDYKNAPANTKVKADSVVELDIKAVDDNGEDIAALCSEARLYELGKGLFPASVEYTADLHSMGQYLQEGRRNLFETVVRFTPHSGELTVPYDAENGDGLNFLAGKAMSDLKQQAMDGTLLAHVEGGVPNIRVCCGERNAFTLGELIYFFCYACGLSGYLLDVNPFDQPGVEAYKKNMFALLGKPGYEDLGAALREKLEKQS